MPLPPSGDAVATEFAGVVAGVEVEVACVTRQVINAMRNQLALAGTGNIMVQHVYSRLSMGVAFPSEVADQFVNAGVKRYRWGGVKGSRRE